MLVYPGGDKEVHRPVWERNRVDFDGRKGWIRLALEQDVPIVPVVAIGGQETSLFLSRGETLAKLLMLDKAFRLKVLPISLALPWGVNVGDFLGHVPLPAKITIETLPPIHLREEFGDDPDLDEVYDARHAAACRRPSTRWPPSAGCRSSDEGRRAHPGLGARRARSGRSSTTRRATCTSCPA